MPRQLSIWGPLTMGSDCEDSTLEHLRLDSFIITFFKKTQDVQKAMDERRFKDAVQLRGR